MRNKWKRKSLATLLALCMVFTMTPAAFAAETDNNSSAVDSAEVKTSTVEVSDENELLRAIQDASGETVIALTEDISTTKLISIAEGENITLDLNGNDLTITPADTNTNGIQVSGTFTLLDSVATEQPAVDSEMRVSYESGKYTYKGYQTAVIIAAGGTFNLESGTIDASGFESRKIDATGVYAVGNYNAEATEGKATTVNINGGYIHAREYGVGVRGLGAVANVQGGVIETEDNAAVAGNGTVSDTQNDGGTIINITGGTLIGNITTAGYIACGVYHPQQGTLNISGGTIYADSGVGVLMRAGDANITGGNIIATGEVNGKVGDSQIVVGSYGVVFDDRSEYPGKEDNDAVLISDKANISGDVGAVTVVAEEASSSNNDRIEITGGTFSHDITDYVAAGNKYENGQVVIDNTTAVAEVNGVGYTSLQGAIDGVVDDTQTTVTLLKDTAENVTISADKNIIFDLNGFTLDGQTTSKSPALTNNGTVIIKDSSTAQTGTIKRSDTSGQSSYYTILNNKTMTIESGNIRNNAGSETTWSGSSLICNGPSSEATLTINGGNIQQDNFIAVKNDEKGTLVVNGGTIKSKTQAVQNWKKADITGGDLTGDVTTWAYSNIAGTTNISDNVVIDGDVGAYWYGKGSGYPVQDGCTPTVNIEGGTVLGSLEKGSIKTTGNAAATPVEPTDATGDINVSGGRFAKPVNVAFVADDVKAQLKRAADSEAPYSYYTSVDAALAAAEPGDEVTVLNASGTVATSDVTIKYGNGSEDLTLTVNNGTEITLPAAPSRDGYTFDGWIVNGERYAAKAKVTINADTIIYADWEPPYTGKYSYEVFTSVGDNGSLTVDRYATEGDKVTIEVTPDEAYLLDELVVTANGKEVELTDNGDGTYTFTMPSADVRISATFAEDPDWTEPEEPATDVSDIFIDVAPNAWYKDAVQYAYAGGLMTGVSANEFAPDATTTRGMIVSMLARLEGVESANDAGFADVSDEWYATAVNWAASVGVVNGYEDGTFRPNDAITREQLAAILMNYAAYKGEDVSARASLDAYSDAENVSTWATDTMQWAVAKGLLTGVTADTLQPQGAATRAQVAAISQRFLSE